MIMGRVAVSLNARSPRILPPEKTYGYVPERQRHDERKLGKRH
jgi:hypothetical protein